MYFNFSATFDIYSKYIMLRYTFKLLRRQMHIQNKLGIFSYFFRALKIVLDTKSFWHRKSK